ncbi:MAG: methyltransferase domain-containing protein [Nitrospinota bacterium]|nr:MAG: methyltransferase domain-containing protein [Nitrospinota bacterium]
MKRGGTGRGKRRKGGKRYQANDTPFRLDQCIEFALLRQALVNANYTQEALAETVKLQDHRKRLDLCMALRRTATPTPYHTLVRLFMLGQAVPPGAAQTALTPMPVEQLLSLGLLRQTETGICSEAMLLPFENLFIAHDFGPDILRRSLPANYVMGVGAASITLADLTVRRRIDSALDLGTGSGIQALLASRHAARVVATDTNRRALNFAELNARLNGISRIEFREGSLYEPVQGEEFDLIVSNPPFVISPESRYLFRDSGLPGDTISEQTVRGAAQHLREGGYCTVLCNWYHQGREDWAERPRQWVANSGCDAWIIRFGTEEPLLYAADWLRPTEARNPERYGRLLDTWLRYYAEMGIGAISSGAIVLRRRSGQVNWVRTDTVVAEQRAGSCSEQIERIFTIQDFLQELGEENDLLDQALQLVPQHQLIHELQAQGGGWSVTAAQIKQTQGFAFTGSVDRLVSTILAGCDGDHTLRELVADLAQGLHLDFTAMVPPCLQVVQALMRMGFLKPVA